MMNQSLAFLPSVRFDIAIPHWTLTYIIPASLLTQHTPEGAWVPVFRPYTPVSDNGNFIPRLLLMFIS